MTVSSILTTTPKLHNFVQSFSSPFTMDVVRLPKITMGNYLFILFIYLFTKDSCLKILKLFDYLIFLFRYFTNHELRELFVLDDPRSSTTQQQLQEMHQHNNTIIISNNI